MKLFITRTSPYGRVARAVALELDLPVEFVVVAVRDAVDELLDYNPAAKVPSLQLDSGMVLSESRLICEYLESIQKSPLPIRLLASLNDEAGRHWEGLITGFLDGISVWVRELRRVPDEQSPAIRALEHRRALRCLAHFELAWSHETQAITYASIMLATTLQLIDMRAPLEWRTGQPKLAAWVDEFVKIPSMQRTAAPTA